MTGYSSYWVLYRGSLSVFLFSILNGRKLLQNSFCFTYRDERFCLKCCAEVWKVGVINFKEKRHHFFLNMVYIGQSEESLYRLL
jgi:hypothetical protein